MQPIWKDYFVNLGTASSYQFRILKDSTPIYEGRAYKKPGESAVYVRINDICADYLPDIVPPLAYGQTKSFYLPTFRVQVKNGSSWTDKGSEIFTPDWSYEAGHSISDIDDVIRDGSVGMLHTTITSSGRMTIVFTTYPSSVYCYEWVLHYKNAYGGWNSLVIEGATIREDQVKRNTYDPEYDNGVSGERGRVNSVNELSRRFTFHTGWLSDDEASRMHHLLNSPNVYLQKIHQGYMGEVYPLVLTNSSTPYKTYKNQGCTMVDYTIEAEVAQTFIRR